MNGLFFFLHTFSISFWNVGDTSVAHWISWHSDDDDLGGKQNQDPPLAATALEKQLRVGFPLIAYRSMKVTARHCIQFILLLLYSGNVLRDSGVQSRGYWTVILGIHLSSTSELALNKKNTFKTRNGGHPNRGVCPECHQNSAHHWMLSTAKLYVSTPCTCHNGVLGIWCPSFTVTVTISFITLSVCTFRKQCQVFILLEWDDPSTEINSNPATHYSGSNLWPVYW